MEMMPVKPERKAHKAQLETYAKEHGQSAAEALDDLLSAQLEAEQRDYDETVQGALRGYEDVKALNTPGRVAIVLTRAPKVKKKDKR